MSKAEKPYMLWVPVCLNACVPCMFMHINMCVVNRVWKQSFLLWGLIRNASSSCLTDMGVSLTIFSLAVLGINILLLLGIQKGMVQLPSYILYHYDYHTFCYFFCVCFGWNLLKLSLSSQIASDLCLTSGLKPTQCDPDSLANLWMDDQNKWWLSGNVGFQTQCNSLSWWATSQTRWIRPDCLAAAILIWS